MRYDTGLVACVLAAVAARSYDGFSGNVPAVFMIAHHNIPNRVPDMLPVSVVIPCYNRENYIRDSVESVLRQSMTGFEIIVVDDGSTDKSVDAIQSINSDKIKLIRLSKNMGISAARNAGISMAQGNLIAFLDSDDLMCEKRLEEQESLFRNDCRTTICGSYFDIIDDKGSLIGSTDCFHNTDRMLKFSATLGCPFHFSTIMVRSTSVGGEKQFFDESLEVGEDYEYMSKNILEGYGCIIKKRLTSCRAHINSKTNDVMNNNPNLHMEIFGRVSLNNMKKIGFNTDIYTSLILREKIFSVNKPNYDALSEVGKAVCQDIEAQFISTFTHWYNSHDVFEQQKAD
ncbi:glycosyltransferase family 2 protein [Azospirillum sp. TSO35-2]|uniref:glycosyltransferase family 2 protein n=1 Tax=Azospirillum sp. TSO35-2 TaxID=716796 RepID=UPI00130499F6|nr:glycosyltransferase family 2 protein [Azospirillum sp. TSO35-2]